MLTTEAIEKAIGMYEGGAAESAVAEAIGISHEEPKAVVDALYLGKTDRLPQEVALPDVLELAAKALRSGQGLIGDTAAVVREVWHSYPGAGLDDRKTHSGPAGGIDQPEKRMEK